MNKNREKFVNSKASDINFAGVPPLGNGNSLKIYLKFP